VLEPALARAGLDVERQPSGGHDGSIVVRRSTPQQVGDIAHAVGARLHLLAPAQDDLETAFLRMVSEAERAGEVAQQAPFAAAEPVAVATGQKGDAS
jgi:hypothetical protein